MCISWLQIKVLLKYFSTIPLKLLFLFILRSKLTKQNYFFQIFFVATTIMLVNGYRSEDAYLNIPGVQTFTDRSALSDKRNLQSRQYHDFIHNLYRFDKENLQKVDNLFEIQNAPTAAPYYPRHKRSIYFRPLFVYRQQILEKHTT